MSRFRTDLRASFPQRKASSTTKFPPVQNDYVARSPSENSQHWATDMVVGLQLRTVSSSKETRPKPTVTTSAKKRIAEMVSPPRKQSTGNTQTNTALQLQIDKLNQETSLFKLQLQELLDKIAKLEKDNEKLKSKCSSQQKTIEQLKGENKMKNNEILELEEMNKKQELIHRSEIDKLLSRLDGKDERIKELEDLLASKDNEIENLKTEFQQKIETQQKEFMASLEEAKANYEKELKEKDDKLKILKTHMADALKDNSRERQFQLEELTRELKKVSEEADILKVKIHANKNSQGGCKNCHILEKELQNKIIELRDKDVGVIELKQLCEKMEKQLMQQDELLRLWAKSKGKVIR